MLECVVFICGAVVMVIELAGSRVLAPYLGTSLVVWTSLIGVILASLSIGYWRGGALADRRPEPRLLGRIILAAGLCTGAVAVLKTLLLAFLQKTLDLHAAALAATMLLFAPPALLLGMVAPFAVRLKMTGAETSGRTAGNLYALSTLGSIVGTFGGGFFLIAYVGSTNILLLMAALLGVAALLAHKSAVLAKAGLTVLFLLCFGTARAYDGYLAERGLHDVDTHYNRVLVYDGVEQATGRTMRELVTGPGARQSAMYVDDPDYLALLYTRFYRLLEYFRPEARNLLMLGGGGYSFPKFALVAYPEMRIDVVEIDPEITEMARRMFALKDDPRLRIFNEDGRVFLNREQGKYDVVCVDAFSSSYSVPFHLATVEAVRGIYDHLNDDGVVLVNVLSSITGNRGRVLRSILAAYREVFPQVYAFKVGVVGEADPAVRQNIMLVAVKGHTSYDLQGDNPVMSFLLGRRMTSLPPDDTPAMTDDFAPIDRYIAGMW